MGLAASQARFLGITLRKANCEFRSTELAQQKIELTDQMSLISENYASAINATKLTWSNEACEGDYGVTYGLLMTPSVANNYNPYMITTKSGAIILNSKYRAAASAAGISMAGCIPDGTGYKKFIAALGVGSNDLGIAAADAQGLITATTQEMLMKEKWHATAGMGALPKDKSLMSQATISDLILDPGIGGQTLDWLQVFRAAKGYSYDDISTNFQYDAELALYDKAINRAKTLYANAKDQASSEDPKPVYGMSVATKIYDEANKSITKQLVGSTYEVKTQNVVFNAGRPNQYVEKWPVFNTSSSAGIILQAFQNLEKQILEEVNPTKKLQWQNELEFLKQGKGRSGTGYNGEFGTPLIIGDNIITDDEYEYAFPLLWAAYEKAKFQAANIGSGGATESLTWDIGTDGNGYHTNNDTAINTSIGFGRIFHTEGDTSVAGGRTAGQKVYVANSTGAQILPNNTFCTMTMYVNNSIVMDESKIKTMTLGDLLTRNVVVMTQVSNYSNGGASNHSDKEQNAAIKTLEVAGEGMLDYIARLFGYNNIGTGINTDETTQAALQQAYDMVKRKFLDATGAVINGERADDSNMLNNDAYVNANRYNRIGVEQNGGQTYAGLNLSNMVSAFLTYFDNALRGPESDYFVGKTNDGEGSRSQFVTDDPSYIYVTNVTNSYTEEEKINDFYSELYNSICEHGWRYDGNVDDYEYLESTIKDGRYAMTALNTDGYFYQQRYNDIEYIIEESDRDAIARAEAEFTRKKAEITAKEDRLDIQTKKLDAEISELTTELNSVQNIIAKSIEKTFALFSN